MKPIFVIILLAIFFRFYLLMEFTPRCCNSDEGTYHSLAKNWVQTGEFVLTKNDDPNLFTDKVYGAKPPLYPMMIAGIYKIFGVNPNAVKIFQILLSALIGFLIFQIGKICFSKEVGFTSLIIYVFFWETAFMSLNLLSENLYWLLMSFLIFILVRRGELKFFHSIFIGILLALLSLTRASSLSFIILILFWILWKKLSFKSVGNILIIIFFFILTLVPWTLRNYSIYNSFVPIYTDGGINFWMGNYPKSGGSYNVPKANDPNQNPILQTKGVARELERDNFYYLQAKNYLLSNPIEAFDTDIRKIFNTFYTYRGYVLNTTTERGTWPFSRPKSLAIDSFMEFLVSYQFAFITSFFVLSMCMLIKNIRKTILHPGVILLMGLFFWNLFQIAISHYEPRYITQFYILMIPIAAVLITPFYLKVLQEFKNK